MSLLEFSLEAWRNTPEMRMRDAYKWLFQATMGGEHAIADDSGPREWLNREWEEIGEPFPNEPIIEPLTPDGRIVRVNLRPYKSLGCDKNAMLDAFVKSARKFSGDLGRFLDEWRALGETLADCAIGHLDSDAWRMLDSLAADAGYPAMHHSPEYEAAYLPAYRILLGEIAKEICRAPRG